MRMGETFGPCERCGTPLRWIGGMGAYCCTCRKLSTTKAARWGTDAKAAERVAVERRRRGKLGP